MARVYSYCFRSTQAFNNESHFIFIDLINISFCTRIAISGPVVPSLSVISVISNPMAPPVDLEYEASGDRRLSSSFSEEAELRHPLIRTEAKKSHEVSDDENSPQGTQEEIFGSDLDSREEDVDKNDNGGLGEEGKGERELAVGQRIVEYAGQCVLRTERRVRERFEMLGKWQCE